MVQATPVVQAGPAPSTDSIERAKPYFMTALLANNEPVITGLLRSGFPVDMRFNELSLPLLHFAVGISNETIFRLLVEGGANLEETSMNGRNFVH